MNQGLVLRVCVLYPRELNMYADRGNLVVLQRRCEWRGITVDVTSADVGEPLDPDADLYYMGGGQDADQQRCAVDLLQHKAAGLAAAANRGAVVLGVCGGFQLLGHTVELAGGVTVRGVGLLDVDTVRTEGQRLVGNAVIDVATRDGARLLAGFENHAGRTVLRAGAHPLGRVRVGHGNNGDDGGEGARTGNVVGTYLHGPLLAHNAWFADDLIRRATGLTELRGLEDELEDAAHAYAVEAAERR